MQESLMKSRTLEASDLFPTDTVSALWDAKILFARCLAALLGISWTDCGAQLYFGSWTRRGNLERSREGMVIIRD